MTKPLYVLKTSGNKYQATWHGLRWTETSFTQLQKLKTLVFIKSAKNYNAITYLLS